MIVLAQVLLSTLFLLEALFEGGSPHLCQVGETVVYFKIISVLLKQKHTAKYKIYFFFNTVESWLGKDFRLNIFSGSISRFK